jgi:hypothetical protein
MKISNANFMDEKTFQTKHQQLIHTLEKEYQTMLNGVLSDIMSQVYIHVNATMTAEQAEDHSTNQKLKTEILKIVDEKLKQSGDGNSMHIQ